MAGYDRNKEKSEKIAGINVGKSRGERFLNTEIYSYDAGAWQARIIPTNKNTNPNADSSKTWIKQKGISQLTVEELKELVKAFEKAIVKLERK